MEEALNSITVKEAYDNVSYYYTLMQTKLSEREHVKALTKYNQWNVLVDKLLKGEIITERPK